MKEKLVIISGPTAVGKSDCAVKLAKMINGEVISADSIQVYRGMDIGTAKVTKEEMDGVVRSFQLTHALSIKVWISVLRSLP